MTAHRLRGTGAALVGLVACVAATAPYAAPPAPPAGCTSAQSRQFDFWVGRWRVTPTAYPDRLVAHSVIEKLYKGCAVRENWAPLNGQDGGSLSSYVPAEGAWRQTWIDSFGARVDFKGGWEGGAMVLTGVWPQPGHPNQLTRMTYTPQGDGSVRQAGQASDDGGATWTPSFDFTYRRDE